MSDPCQIREKRLTGEKMHKLAELLAEYLPDDAKAVIALVDTCISDCDRFSIGDTMEVVELANPSAIDVEESMERMNDYIRGAFEQMIYSDGECFDEERFPVLVFSIESDFDYYALVAISVETDYSERIDETNTILAIASYLDDNAPEPDDYEESVPEVYRVFGTFANHVTIYSLDFVDDDED